MFTHSGASNERITSLNEKLVKTLNEDVVINISDGIDTSMDVKNQVSDPLPVIVLINGAGGNGKDTFINAVNRTLAVYNLSTIDPIKTIAGQLIDITDSYSQFEKISGSSEMTNKSDRYREFLHELKMAWANFNDGPNVNMLGEIQNILNIHEHGGEKYDVIFVHVREPKEIDELKNDIFRYFGISCITMLVKGRVDPSEYNNNCDKNVYNYKHDIVLANTGNTTVLDMQALFFATRLHKINNEYGIPCPECNHTETEATEAKDVLTEELVSDTEIDDTIINTVNSVKDDINEVISTTLEERATGGESEDIPSLAGFHPNVDAADLT